MDAVFKILIVFALMLLASRCRCPLGLSLVGGGLALNLWAGWSPADTAVHLGRACIAPDLWLLVAVTALIIEVARFMTAGDNAREIVAATRRWGGRHGHSVSLMALPAVIGLVPMPAGALFSAPLVQHVSHDSELAADWKSAVNYWFRHVWEYWWPLYPGVIITMAIFEMDAWLFFAVQVPFTLVAIGSGFLFLIRPHAANLSAAAGSGEGSNRRTALIFVPLMVVIVSILIIPAGLQHVRPAMTVQARKVLSLLIGLLIAIAIIAAVEFARRQRKSAGDGTAMFSTLLKPQSRSVLISLTGILMFKSLLESSGLLPVAGDEIIASGLPLGVAIAALPFLAGLVTGLAVGFTGITFPLVVGLMAVEGSGLTPLATLVLAYGFGYMGMMLSPVHLCLLVTRDYFSARLPLIYRQLVPCVLAILAFSLALHAAFVALGI